MWLIDRLKEYGAGEAMVWRDESFSYRWLLEAKEGWQVRLKEAGIESGQVVSLGGSFSPQILGLFLALMENRNILVPLVSASQDQQEEFLKIAQVQAVFHLDGSSTWRLERRSAWCGFHSPQPERREVQVDHPLLKQLQEQRAPGLVLFSSGSTGVPKAALHNLELLLEKFKRPRHRMRTLLFLLLDHIGGVNTLFYTLANGGTVISVEDRSAQGVCRAIHENRVEMLPTSPTFLNLLLISEEYKNFDLSVLRLITYGTEPMPASTLARLNAIFPQVRFQQTYGLSELGILRSKSKDSTSLWVKIGGEGYETKVVDNLLWIRTRHAMLGYLNAPPAFDQEGWFNTQDLVEVEGEYLRILGRKSEMINVGGEKVYPAQVESVLMKMENVRDVTVRGEKNPILGNIVVAQFTLIEPEPLDSLRRRVREFCKDRIPRHQIPARVEIGDSPLVSARFKKDRRPVGSPSEVVG